MRPEGQRAAFVQNVNGLFKPKSLTWKIRWRPAPKVFLERAFFAMALAFLDKRLRKVRPPDNLVVDAARKDIVHRKIDVHPLQRFENLLVAFVSPYDDLRKFLLQFIAIRLDIQADDMALQIVFLYREFHAWNAVEAYLLGSREKIRKAACRVVVCQCNGG